MKTDDRVMLIPDFIVVLKSLEDNSEKTMTDIFVETRITYCHLYGIKRLLKKKGWLVIRTEGKKHFMRISNEGERAVKAASVFLEAIGVREEDFARYRAKTKTKHKEEPKEEIKEEQIDTAENNFDEETIGEVGEDTTDEEEII